VIRLFIGAGYFVREGMGREAQFVERASSNKEDGRMGSIWMGDIRGPETNRGVWSEDVQARGAL